ncbi:hypothetical protein PMAYCL1PPCAC_09903 [Pristionchus mayeri]|uniref:PAZ domain-containing protein n=1 Tax=Pristionchus mayeri TaxID=1317129 RepID=A0AAN5C6X0_9BILA|nr:hypothetical protein PMAYCL1PPCAC_09903 [Pristionchus mayeri]
MTATPAEEMAKMTIKTAVPAPPKLAKGKKGAPRKVVTNSFLASLKPNTPFFLHDCRIYAVFDRKGEEKLKEVTKQTRDDFLEQDRKSAAIQAYLAIRTTGALKGDTFYDRAALLITLQEIAECKAGGEFRTTLTSKTAPKLFALESIKEAKEVRIVIKKAADSYQVTSNDLASTNEATRKALLSVVNLATSQALFEKTEDFVVYGNGNAFLLEPEQHGFRTFDVGTADKYGGVGLTKGARFVEGAGGKPAAAVTVDVKKTAFHKDYEVVADKLRNNGCDGHPGEATQVIAGLKALVWYSGIPAKEQKARVITIGMVSNERVKDVVFSDANGKRATLPQYILAKYKTQIKNPNAFVIVDKYEQNKYSPECLRIAPNQRVKSENQQPAVIEKLIRESASLPAKRQGETATLAKCLDAGANNAAQLKRGVTVDTAKPIEIEGRVLDAVKLGTGAPAPLSVNGPWRQGRIAQAPLDRFSKWTVLHINNGADPDNLGATTAQSLVKYARDIGYNIQMALSVVSVRLEPNQEAQLEQIFEHETKNGSQFILVICNARIKNHGLIKLLEIKYDVVTEQYTN